MITRRSLLFAFCAPFFVTASAVFAKNDDPSAQELSPFEKMFPTPTGTNGLEELVRAAESVNKAKAEYPPTREFTLAKKRAYLADPACQEALLLVRQGLGKTLLVPQTDPNDPFPLFSLLRALSRLLGIQVYVQFADGKNEAALQTLRDNGMMSSSVKGVSLIGLLTGSAMDAIVLTHFIRLREVWTPRDCQHIISVATQQLNMPNPAIAAMESERKITMQQMAIWRKDPAALPQILTDFYEPYDDSEPESTDQSQAREYAQTLQLNGAIREQVTRELVGMVQTHFDRAIDLIQNPTKHIHLAPPDTDTSGHPITKFVRSTVLSEGQGTITKGIENCLILQLLGLHAAIRRYRWEYDKLPTNLAEVEIARPFLRDPYTDENLLYTLSPDGLSYKLGSAGALTTGDDGKEARTPFYFPREPRF